jgi:DNA sulfur modification protein DndD
MILDRLILHNFGVYRGRHIIDLTPPNPNKPVILVGALNGSGKTTFLDALQLVLYGRLSQCSNRGNLAYDEYLRRCIHRSVDPSEGAALELEFRHRTEGEQCEYRIHRSWSAREKGVREVVEVLREGALDPLLTESWTEYVEDLIPIRLSKFFFFDGEKIEALADLERSSEVLSTAIQSLLGLDIVDQLITDLKVVERRNREQQKPEAEREAVAAARADVARLESRCAEARALVGAQTNQVQRQTNRLRDAEGAFRRAGGDAFTRRQELEESRERLRALRVKHEDGLREVAAGAAPLLLVPDLLEDLRTAASVSGGRDPTEVLTLLKERDAKAIRVAKVAGATNALVSALRRFFEDDRKARQGLTEGYSMVLPGEARSQLLDTIWRDLGSAGGECANLLDQVAKVEAELQGVERRLASAPDKDALSGVLAELEDARRELGRTEGALALAEEELGRVERERESRWGAYSKELEKDLDDQFRDQVAERIVVHSGFLRSTMAVFRSRVVERHVHRLETLILESFRHLLRKESLVANLVIDPITYRIALHDRFGGTITPDRLSAGERQLLAVSIIWGLARASGRPLPVIIDTPLGRMDSVHRTHLVERYFPTASHQVILLSTDKEIASDELERLRPAVGRSFTLVYDDATEGSHVEPGYFEEGRLE